jgi:hypothetical protein
MIGMSCSSRTDFAPHSHPPAHSTLAPLETTCLPAPDSANFSSSLLSHSCAMTLRKQATFAFFRDMLNLLWSHFALIALPPPIGRSETRQHDAHLQTAAGARRQLRFSSALRRHDRYSVLYTFA